MKNKAKYIGIIAVITCIAALLLAGCQTYKPSDYKQWGDNYFEQGKYDDAIRCYNWLLDEYPKSPLAEEAKAKIAEAEKRKGNSPQGQQQQQAQAQTATLVRITEPVTEADFRYQQNAQGGITILKYLPVRKGMVLETLVIPDQVQGIKVTEIAKMAFRRGSIYNVDGKFYPDVDGYEGEEFENVIIPPTVTTIGEAAFFGRGIKTLTLPDSVTAIGPEAFRYNQLTTVKLPASLRSVGYETFDHNQLTSIDIAGLSIIPQRYFSNNKLTEVTIPANVTRIYEGAFSGNNISKINFSGSGKLKTIEESSFYNNSLKSVVLPEGITIIGKDAFGKNPLAYIKFPTTFKGEQEEKGEAYGRITQGTVPIIEWLQPGCYTKAGLINFQNADVLKLGANLDIVEISRYEGFGIKTTRRDRYGELEAYYLNVAPGFANFYISQGKKEGIYIRKGQIWVMGTQEEFDALVAEKTK